VDDGKSTLIGRLCHETGSIQDDLYEDLRQASLRRGRGELDLAFLLDGLATEREQSVTVDVAYRYFATATRKYAVADCPGHEQYTRNMFTGMSSAEVAVLLIDARKGLTPQSKRHALIVSLLGIPHLVVAVNKMDLVDWSERRFAAVVAEYQEFAETLALSDVTFIPVCARDGDNVVEPGRRMPWYDGARLLEHLERVPVGRDRNPIDFRFPVQYVVRAPPDLRGLAGRVASGAIRPGEEIAVMPAGRVTRVSSILTFAERGRQADAGESVLLTVTDAVDIGRGDLLARRNNLPQVADRLDTTLCWMTDAPLAAGASVLFVQTARTVAASVTRIHYRIDVNTLHREPTAQLRLNDIARVDLHTAQPVCFDPYRLNRFTGGFLLVDPTTADTMAAGVIRGPLRTLETVAREVASDGIGTEAGASPGQRAAVLWLTGLPAAGKSTLAQALAARLEAAGHRVVVLDGDALRLGLCSDLGFTESDRDENVRRTAEVARLFYQSGTLVICSLISPRRRHRALARSLFPAAHFFEIYVRASLETCEKRDPKGLYGRARSGQVAQFTGISAGYEEPLEPELLLDTEQRSVAELVDLVLQRARLEGLIR
jgi:bifunctional enzyme CysN/CysC